jgi:hypothetical protein
MKKRPKVASLLVVGCVVLVGMAYFLLKPASSTEPFDPRAYDRIRPGMTRGEVVAAVGLPPGDYDMGVGVGPVGKVKTWGDGDKELGAGQTFLRWRGDHYLMSAVFTSDCLTGCCLIAYDEPSQSAVIRRLRDLVGW